MNYFKLNPERAVLLQGEVNGETIGDLLPTIAKLDEEVHPDGIVQYIASPGGLATVGLAVYDLLKTRRNRVVTVGMGECSSIASVILQAGNVRLLMPHTRILLHFGRVTMNHETQLKAPDLAAGGREITRLNGIVLDILSERIRGRHSRNKLAELLRQETYLDAYEAVKWGLADSVIYTPTYIPLPRRK